MSRGKLNEVSDLTIEVAAILRERIARKQIKQAEIAKATKISTTQLSGIVNGEKRIDIEQLDRIAQALGLTLLEVVEKADSESAHRRIDSGIKPLVT
jgi:transcriptional regulator with XRE-family HTH domain